MTNERRRGQADLLQDTLPAMTYQDLSLALEMVAAGADHLSLIPHLVSGLRQQAPFLTGRMVMFEILRAANCLAEAGRGTALDG